MNQTLIENVRLAINPKFQDVELDGALRISNQVNFEDRAFFV